MTAVGVQSNKRQNDIGQRVILVNDQHEIIHEGLAEVVREHFPQYVCVGVKAKEVIEMPESRKVCLLITDWNGKDGDFLRQILARSPGLPILVYTETSGDFYSRRALKCGAKGFVGKRQPVAQLVEAMRQLLRGQSNFAADVLLATSSLAIAPSKTNEVLSRRENIVLHKLAHGKSVKEIASELLVSVKTITTYKSNLFQKLGFQSNTDLVRYAMDNGII